MSWLIKLEHLHQKQLSLGIISSESEGDCLVVLVGDDIADSTPESESELTEESFVMERFSSTAVANDLSLSEQLSLSVKWAAETVLDTFLLTGVSLIGSEARELGV